MRDLLAEGITCPICDVCPDRSRLKYRLNLRLLHLAAGFRYCRVGGVA